MPIIIMARGRCAQGGGGNGDDAERVSRRRLLAGFS